MSETKKMNIAKRQNSYVIIGENEQELLISKSKYSERHSVNQQFHNLEEPEDLDETIFEMDAMIFTASQARLL